MATNFINGTTSGTFWATISILLSLLIVSHLFDTSITRAGTRAEGMDWMLVVIGVSYTQIAIGLLDLLLGWNAFFLGMLAYGASGLPMILGAYRRQREMRRRADKALHE